MYFSNLVYCKCENYYYLYVRIALHVFKSYFKAHSFAPFFLLIANFSTFPFILTDGFYGLFVFFGFVTLADGFFVFFAALGTSRVSYHFLSKEIVFYCSLKFL